MIQGKRCRVSSWLPTVQRIKVDCRASRDGLAEYCIGWRSPIRRTTVCAVTQPPPLVYGDRHKMIVTFLHGNRGTKHMDIPFKYIHTG